MRCLLGGFLGSLFCAALAVGMAWGQTSPGGAASSSPKDRAAVAGAGAADVPQVLAPLIVAGPAESGGSSQPQAEKAKATPPAKAATASNTLDPQVKQASCCGGGLLGGPGDAGYGCGDGHCVPGRKPCTWCNYDTVFGRCLGGLYDCICCPDPCYEPSWIAEANQAFFQDGPRPVTQTRIRWDSAYGYEHPDTAEFFWAKIGQKGPKTFASAIDYDALSLYQEIAAKNFSFFFEMPYLDVDPSGAGFGDMNLGTKAAFLDCELLLMTFQFRTYLPVGNFARGLGTGHVSLEPSLLGALKITRTTYLQSQLTEWIPIAGTPNAAGSVFEYHFSLNQGLWHPNNTVNVVANLELNGYAFQGQYTGVDAAGTQVSLGMHGASYMNAGPGLRIIMCNKIDIGAGMAFGFGASNGPEQIYRTELRIRY
jgi:hypothetical protein